ncbi:hypothetical protein CkaCkLH20_12628 [Colletotrichum karsti]|uniref:Uncharacterized protein n=1 Tax=Colletotrichum karsti TaxID=1095194 RepID=A0A9P6HW09_9PEZI|nr:uncharacterized protein CkaCkLH20_12628 [Colletotrichum karsti]KAF9869921.1 hypothetical protein CkaCkLH20_12628 [Colletotrichum karsti]
MSRPGRYHCQALDEALRGLSRPFPLSPAPVPACPLPFAAKLVARLAEIRHPHQKDDELRGILLSLKADEVARLERLGEDGSVDDFAEDDGVLGNADELLARERMGGAELIILPIDDEGMQRMMDEEADACRGQFWLRQLDGDYTPDVKSSDVSEPGQEIWAGSPFTHIDARSTRYSTGMMI